MLVASLNSTATVRVDRSPACTVPLVVMPVAIVSVHNVFFASFAAVVLICNEAPEAPELLALTVKVVVPHPLGTGVPTVPHTNSGKINVTLSETPRSAVDANTNLNVVVAEVTGVEKIKML